MSLYMATTTARRAASEVKTEGVLRGACALLAAAAALLVGLNTQTETVILIRKKATVKDVQALWVLAMATAATAGYHLLQLLRCFFFSRFFTDGGDAKPPCWGVRGGAGRRARSAVEQVAGSLVCGMLAAVAAASSRNLFRLYPSAPPPSFAG
uniref:CASP-like protein n=1 Tax=Leersia perrieri TaxID=77586 RepID=A0A0D9WST1_9ORYZ